jgi:hypothetical protein
MSKCMMINSAAKTESNQNGAAETARDKTAYPPSFSFIVLVRVLVFYYVVLAFIANLT